MFEKRPTWRRDALPSLVLVLFLSGFSSAPPASDIDPDIAEAVFRYQFAHNASGQKAEANVYCIGFSSRSADGGINRDPSTEFLTRFADVKPPVKAASQCSFDKKFGNSVVDRSTGGFGLIFRIESVKCADNSHCDVQGGYYEANESSSGNTYHLEKQREKWVVVGDNMNWIS